VREPGIRLPNRESAYVPEQKLDGYLLSENHPVGRAKALLLRGFGYGRPMIRELDTVVLTRDIEEHSLKRGDVGAVVHCYPDEKAFEVEFVTGEGTTAAVLTLTTADIRSMGKGDILHAREFTAT
jgi:hypothetical protein